MPLSPGQIIKGARASYRLLHPLKGKTVFKAEILEARDLKQRWSVLPMLSFKTRANKEPTYQGRYKNRNRPPRTLRPPARVPNLPKPIRSRESLYPLPTRGVGGHGKSQRRACRWFGAAVFGVGVDGY